MRFLLTVFLMSFCACDTTGAGGGDYTCSNTPTIKNAQGGVHGAACVKNSDCEYGSCSKSALQLAGHVTTTEGVCTKDCSCGSASSQCSTDDDETNGVHFSCIKAIGTPSSECALKCTSVADCQKVNPRFNTCTETSSSFGTGVKVCTIQ